MSEPTQDPPLHLLYLRYARKAHDERPRTMYGIITDLLREAWCRETASPSCQADWTTANPALGQCAVSALVVQDLIGGIIVRAVIPGSGSHYWNEIPNGEDVHVFDPTRSQFPSSTVIPRGERVVREYILGSERALLAGTPERYALLKDRVREIMRQA